ncbi:MAG TPA: hypothetical protein VKU77_18010 [Streptosporangiaceae bacterium]|jgi:uncharacterized protein YtpQ (UPF0354 family)|nr:hypothetical protein [Streptosporangiaceae bacterium]
MAAGELDPSLILPLIKRIEPQSMYPPASVPDTDLPVTEQLAGGLLVAYVFDMPGMFRYLSAATCSLLHLTTDDLRPLAVRNLTRRRARPQIKGAPAAAMLVLDGDLEASLLLVDHLWEQIGTQLPGDLIAAVPSRDTLFITSSQEPGGTAALTRAVDAVWRKSEDRLLLTRSLLIRDGRSWSPFSSQPT